MTGQDPDDLGITPETRFAFGALGHYRPNELEHQNVQYLMHNVQLLAKMSAAVEKANANTRDLIALHARIEPASKLMLNEGASALHEARKALVTGVDSVAREALQGFSALIETVPATLKQSLNVPLSGMVGTVHRLESVVREIEDKRAALVKQQADFEARMATVKAEIAAERQDLSNEAQKHALRVKAFNDAQALAKKRQGVLARLFS